jgi:hypothetical protein
MFESVLDLHILFYIPSLATWSEDTITRYFGTPQAVDLTLYSYDNYDDDSDDELAPESPHAPEYGVPSPDFEDLIELCFSSASQVHVKICESFFLQEPRRSLKIPSPYLAPEAIFHEILGRPSDI